MARCEARDRGEPPPPDRPAVPDSDVGNAFEFRRDHAAVVRFVDVWASWLVWDGRRWEVDRRRAADALAKQTVHRLHQEAVAELARLKPLLEAAGDEPDPQLAAQKKAAGARYGWAKRSHSAQALARMIALARSEPGIGLLPEVFDVDPWAFNTPAGTVDLRTGEVRPHRRDDCITKIAATAYDPAARCPAWEEFLRGVFEGDGELVGFVRRLFGYALTGQTSEHVLAVFWGSGSNGKSTLLETVMAVVGPDYTMKAPHNLLMARDHETHPTERADLHGKRLVCAVETEDGKRLAESLVKELTGGDTIRARRMRENFFEFAPTHKLVLCTNHKPQVRGTDNGIWRRLRLVPFGARFWNPDEPAKPGESRPPHLRADKGLKDRLAAEREGILAWMVRGCLEWQRDGLGLPKRVAEATSEYRGEEDLIGQFVTDRCERWDDARVKASDLYAALRQWCERRGLKDCPSQRAFGEGMTAAGYERTTSNGTWYKGLRFTQEQTELW
jgi:putative DNA primase/helicase